VNSVKEGAWRWSLGAIYRDAEDDLFSNLSLPILPAPVDWTNKSLSTAVFGELTRLFMNGRFELTAGLRHFDDEVTFQENVPHSGVPTDALLHTTSHFHADTPRGVFTWHVNKDATAYASYGEGFRSGFTQNAFALAVAPNFPSVK